MVGMIGRLAVGALSLLGLLVTNPVNAQEVSDTSKMSVPFIEQMPAFPGGTNEMFNFIRHNLNYPRQARKKQISGKVEVEFFIDEKGNVVDEKVVKAIGGGCDEEALRVVRLMPRWQPGKRNGVPDKVKYTLPFIFNL